MSDQHRDADYHDAHMNDPDEWENVAEEATTRPSGMTIFSLRIPNPELDTLRVVARERGVSVGELLRVAARAYLNPVRIYGQVGNLAPTQISHAASGQIQSVVIVPTQRDARADERNARPPRLVA
jgi:hypothetical protein